VAGFLAEWEGGLRSETEGLWLSIRILAAAFFSNSCETPSVPADGATSP